MRRFGSGRAGFWMRHLRVSCLCFCWMPTVTSLKLHGQSRSVSTAAKKNNYIQWSVLGRTLARSSLEGGEHLLSCGSDFLWTLLQHSDRLCVSSCQLFHVHRCCALHHDGYGLQLAAAKGRRDHRPFLCVFQHQLTCMDT